MASPFRQSDVTKAIRAAKAAGMDVGRVDIAADGRITIMAAAKTSAPALSPYDEWKAKHDARAAQGRP